MNLSQILNYPHSLFVINRFIRKFEGSKMLLNENIHYFSNC